MPDVNRDIQHILTVPVESIPITKIVEEANAHTAFRTIGFEAITAEPGLSYSAHIRYEMVVHPGADTDTYALQAYIVYLRAETSEPNIPYPYTNTIALGVDSVLHPAHGKDACVVYVRRRLMEAFQPRRGARPLFLSTSQTHSCDDRPRKDVRDTAVDHLFTRAGEVIYAHYMFRI